MKAISIQNFRFGLDVRRLEETTQPGVLSELSNAHINQGGEVEKRKSFVRGSLPAGTFGAQVTSQGIAVFGSEDLSAEEFPSPFYYVRCLPEAGMEMVGVISSTTFDSETIAICDFGEDGIFTFKGEDILDDLSPGRLALINASPTALADYYAALINASDEGYEATASAGTLTVSRTDAAEFTVNYANDRVCTTTPGSPPTISASVVESGQPGIPGVAPRAQFRIVAINTSGTGGIYSITIGGTEILGSAVASNSAANTAGMAGNVADTINAYCAAQIPPINLIASASDDTVAIRSTDSTEYEDWNTDDLIVYVNDDVAIGLCAVAITQTSGVATIPSVDELQVNGVDILTSASVTGTSLEDLVANVKNDIDLAKGYCAVAVDNVLYLSRLVTNSNNSPVPVNFVMTNGVATDVSDSGLDGTSGGGSGGGTQSSSLNPTLGYLNGYGVFTYVYRWTRGPSDYKGNFSTEGEVICHVQGGVPPYTFAWDYGWLAYDSGDVDGSGALRQRERGTNYVSNPGNNPTARYSRAGYSVIHSITCQVTDSAGSVVTVGQAAKIEGFQ